MGGDFGLFGIVCILIMGESGLYLLEGAERIAELGLVFEVAKELGEEAERV